jgi:hypothetical protein
MDSTLRRHFIESGIQLHWQHPEPWRHLKMLESRDLCAALINRRHRREPNAKQSLELATAIAQGRQYFESAELASHLTRPLLLYYGVLSLTRAAILASRRNGRESSLAEGHGLKANRWKESLSESKKTIMEL